MKPQKVLMTYKDDHGESGENMSEPSHALVSFPVVLPHCVYNII